ncbi:MAG: sulfate ABC transporter permease subunit CysW [Planctomyces sp.]|nr:sulfate ABC transporter permease subunit CysW [Planctomyces sp.]
MKPDAARRRPGVGSGRPTEPAWGRRLLISLALSVLIVLVVIPVASVFGYAFSKGWDHYWNTLLRDPDTRHAMWLTLVVAPTSVLLNVVFGIAAAWALTRFEFRGRTLLTTFLDLPFAVSPVVAGLMFVLLFGATGVFGPQLQSWGVTIIFSTPGLILATTFVTLPFVARELIPVMQAIGPEEELAAITLGANGWQMFRRITLPNIKWGLLYGVILCNARAMGEYGAVYVVSGHISGQTDTLPLRVEKLLQEFDTAGSFAVASVLTFLALVTLIVKSFLEARTARDLEEAPADDAGLPPDDIEAPAASSEPASTSAAAITAAGI